MSIRKPTNLKVVAGTARPDRITPIGIDLPPVTDVPAAPDWLPNAHAIREFDRLAAMLTVNRVLTEAAVGPLAMLCAQFGWLVDDNTRRVKPTASDMNAYLAYCNAFGLPPIAQGKVKPVAEEKAGSRYAAFGKRPA